MPLRVIGTGYGRTGTYSLKLALDRLGFGPTHHMALVRQDPKALADWNAVYDGASPDWERLFEGFDSCADWPGTGFWRELAQAFPEAKLIHTVRDPDAWWESTRATIFARAGEPATDPFALLNAKIIRREFDARVGDKSYMVERFQRHTDAVRAAIPADRLLVYDVEAGWEPLCRFLAVPVPDEPLPNANTREEFIARSRAAPSR